MRRAPAAVAPALALLLAVAGALLPAAAPSVPVPAAFAPAVALAADDIEITTETRYTVDPDDRVVRVVVAITAVNRRPDLVTGAGVTRYFFDGVNLGVQPEAKRFRATQGGSAVGVSSDRRGTFRLLTVSFAQNLYFGETARVRLAFVLPAGEPRSESDVRVGSAFATFTAWAFGDRGTVRIDVPATFSVDIGGRDMEPRDGGGNLRSWTATAPDALTWYAWVNATNDDALTRDRLTLADGDEVVIRGWPEDRAWRDLVRELLRDGVPELVERIGLPWPVDGALEITEVHTPLLEGYAGFYDPEADRITVSEELDALTVVHEASHAWFNSELFSERWISEGLADEYSSRVLDALGRGRPGPDRVTRRDEVAFPLGAWPPPAAIRDQESGEREAWGYAAAWALMRRIVDRVGEDGMREVLLAAESGTVAYTGEDAPERSRLPNDWRRFLDLVEEAEAAAAADGEPAPAAEPDERSIADLLELWVLPDADARLLEPREAARDAYRDLIEAGGEWAPPDAVRMALDSWHFPDALDLAERAEAMLARRDELAAAAAAEGLTPDPAIEAAYQGAGSGGELSTVDVRQDRARETLAKVAAARAAAEAPRDWLADLGLDGADPAATVAEAGDAWEAGDYVAAETRADGLVATLAAAPDAGRTKAIAYGAAVAAGLVALLIALLLVRGMAHRRRAPAPALPPVSITGGPPERPDPYATLPPDASPGPPPGAPSPGDQGADRS